MTDKQIQQTHTQIGLQGRRVQEMNITTNIPQIYHKIYKSRYIQMGEIAIEYKLAIHAWAKIHHAVSY